jgi:hypothetical protein
MRYWLVFNMQNSKKGFLPFKKRVALSKEQCLSTPKEIESVKAVPYAWHVEA